jgi:hypothetical protein
VRRNAAIGGQALKHHGPRPALHPHSQHQRLLAAGAAAAPGVVGVVVGGVVVVVVVVLGQAEVEGERAVVRVGGPDGEEEELWGVCAGEGVWLRVGKGMGGGCGGYVCM